MSEDIPNVEQSGLEIPDEEFAAAVSPSDFKGRLNFRCDEALQREIEQIAEDSRYPLNSPSEVIRYCCLVGMERLRAWQKGPTLLANIKSATALILRDKIQSEVVEMLAQLDDRMRWYIDNGYYDEGIDLVAKIRSYFDGTTNFWSEYVQRELDERFIKWLDEIDIKRKA